MKTFEEGVLQTLRQLGDRLANLERRMVRQVYVEGAWPSAPIFSGDGVAGTFTYTIQQGYFTRIGNRCLINGYIATSAFSVAPTGNMRIMNLPFPASADANNYAAIGFRISLLDLDAGYAYAIGQINPGDQFIYIVECGDNVIAATLPGSTFDNQPGVNIIFSGQYKI